MSVSFEKYIENFLSKASQSPLTLVVSYYWQDYQNGVPIDGGVAYETLLRKIPLDGSLASLQIIDKFLDKAKPHLATNPLLLKQEIDQRNLLTFIAFYTGLVLDYHVNQAAFANLHGHSFRSYWVNFDKISQAIPTIKQISDDDFSYSMAISLLPLDTNQPLTANIVNDCVFFPYLPIIKRLYPPHQDVGDSPMLSFGFISDSLFESVQQILNRWQNLCLENPTPPVDSVLTNEPKSQQDILLCPTKETKNEKTENQEKPQTKLADTIAHPHISKKLLYQQKSLIDNTPVKQDIFGELETDLQTPQLPNSLTNEAKTAYQQAILLLNHHPDDSQTVKAVSLVQKLANANISDAMLHQALWLLRGRDDLGIAQNVERGLALVEQSAQLQDNRAEKLLSKLYFGGEIVKMDSEQGKYWLEQSALHGHEEAKKLQQSFALVNTLTEARHDEDNYLKKLAVGTVILVILTLIVIFAVKI